MLKIGKLESSLAAIQLSLTHLLLTGGGAWSSHAFPGLFCPPPYLLGLSQTKKLFEHVLF